jgi:thymidylate kinase
VLPILLKGGKNMVIIIEGIDRVGKTTLATMLQDELTKSNPLSALNFKAERVEIPLLKLDEANILNFGCCMGQVQLFNQAYAKRKDNHIIIDRFHWTEYVYTKINRDKQLSKYYLNKIDAEILKEKDGYLIIHVMPTDMKWSSKQHGSNLKEHELLFEELYNESNLNKYRCTFKSLNLAVDKVKEFVNG